MRHGSNKFKVRLGKDANKMLFRKLATNFLKIGKIVTTEKKARLLKMYLERIVGKTKSKTESNKNYLLKQLASTSLVSSLFETVGPVMSDRVGGYVTMTKLSQRDSDGTLMIRLEWVKPVITDKKKPEIEESTQKKK